MPTKNGYLACSDNKTVLIIAKHTFNKCGQLTFNPALGLPHSNKQFSTCWCVISKRCRRLLFWHTLYYGYFDCVWYFRLLCSIF